MLLCLDTFLSRLLIKKIHLLCLLPGDRFCDILRVMEINEVCPWCKLLTKVESYEKPPFYVPYLPTVPPDDPKKPIRPDLSRSTPKNTILILLLPVLFVLQLELKFLLCLLALFHVPVRARQLSKQKICIIIILVHSPVIFL